MGIRHPQTRTLCCCDRLLVACSGPQAAGFVRLPRGTAGDCGELSCSSVDAERGRGPGQPPASARGSAAAAMRSWSATSFPFCPTQPLRKAEKDTPRPGRGRSNGKHGRGRGGEGVTPDRAKNSQRGRRWCWPRCAIRSGPAGGGSTVLSEAPPGLTRWGAEHPYGCP